jgi:hypothetical protein
MRLRQSGVERDCLPVASDRRVKLAFCLQAEGEAELDLGIVGPDDRRLPVGGNGAVEIAVAPEQIPGMVLGLDLDGAPVGGGGLVQLAGFGKSNAQIGIRVAEIGFQGGGFAIGGDRLVKLSFFFKLLARWKWASG